MNFMKQNTKTPLARYMAFFNSPKIYQNPDSPAALRPRKSFGYGIEPTPPKSAGTRLREILWAIFCLAPFSPRKPFVICADDPPLEPH